MVELNHFTPKVEQLQGGLNSTGPTTDIDYTITKFPNHHRALNSALQWHLMERDATPRQGTGFVLKTPMECYFQRALNYAPDDAITHMLYAALLQREARPEQAAKHYETARELAPNTPNIEYNYALLLLDLERYSEARDIAEKLYAQGFPLLGLKNRLVAQEQW